MPTAGQTIIPGRLPGERVATTIETSDSSAAGASEVNIFSVTAALVSGRTYRIRTIYDIQGSVAADTFFLRIREDSLSGTVLSLRRWRMHQVGGVNFPYADEVEYTAASTGNKTFVVGAIREAGTGLLTRTSSATSPGYMYTDFIRG